MTTIVTRQTGATAKGSPLSNAEMDANLINLNTDKLEKSSNLSDLSDPAAARANLGITITSIPKRYLNIIAVEKSTVLVNANDIIGTVEIPVTGTITNLRAKTTSGTATVGFRLNGSTIATISATSAGVGATGSIAVSAWDDLTLDVSSVSSAVGLTVILTIQE